MKFSLARFPVLPSSRFLILTVVVTLLISQAAAQIVQIPDPNLREGIRKQLQLPAGTPITQQQMEKLHHLDAYSMAITDLTGLEYAISLKSLRAWDNPISDLTPLANLTALTVLDLGGCQIVDLTPLQNLTELTYLQLSGNPIVDISHLANLTQLEELKLQHTLILDYSPIEHLSIPRLIRDYPCELPYLPIKERLQNRNFPSVFSAWGRTTYSQVRNLPELSKTEQLALHDLNWHEPYFTLYFLKKNDEWTLIGNLTEALKRRDSLLALNPNMLFIVEIRVRDEFLSRHGEDWPYWLRDSEGNLIETGSRSGDLHLTDFTQPAMQDMIVQQAVAVAECGLFDGIFFDWFAEAGRTVTLGYYTYEEEQQAKDTILQRIREAVPNDLLIIINTGRHKIPRKAWGINGIFMETLQDTRKGLSVIDGDLYGYEGLKQIEDTLLWAEENLREPQINCLEGWGIPTEPPDSPNNLRWMRVFTTMSLTLSDGYVLYGMENSHQHIWYDFWDADLGRPVGPKAQQHQNIDGLFIREYTNGWAVYNRSGKAQTITLPRISIGVSSNKQDTIHLLPDPDGEIYLRKGKPFDLNRDGTVNILDLILASQYFGTNEGDINGDGTTDILDLTVVAQQLSQ